MQAVNALDVLNEGKIYTTLKQLLALLRWRFQWVRVF